MDQQRRNGLLLAVLFGAASVGSLLALSALSRRKQQKQNQLPPPKAATSSPQQRTSTSSAPQRQQVQQQCDDLSAFTMDLGGIKNNTNSGGSATGEGSSSARDATNATPATTSGERSHDDSTSDYTTTAALHSSAGPAVHYNRGRRPTVCGVSTNLDETRMYQPPETAPKTTGEAEQLHDALRRCHLFTHLDEDELLVVVGAMQKEVFHLGECVTRQGELMDIDRHDCYAILSGEVSVIVDGIVTKVLTAGSTFGENHIMFVQPRAPSTHRVDSDACVLFSLSAEAYRHIVTRAAVNKRELYEGFLDRVSWLKGLTHMEKLQLADCLQPVVYRAGEYLIEFNTIGDWVFIILEGTVDVYGRDHGEVMYVCSFSVGDCVGELEFINHHRTVADVRARGKVKAARLHREHFEMCMGPIVDVLRRTASVDDKYAYYQNVIRHMRRRPGAGGDAGPGGGAVGGGSGSGGGGGSEMEPDALYASD